MLHDAHGLEKRSHGVLEISCIFHLGRAIEILRRPELITLRPWRKEFVMQYDPKLSPAGRYHKQ